MKARIDPSSELMLIDLIEKCVHNLRMAISILFLLLRRYEPSSPITKELDGEIFFKFQNVY